MSRERNLANGVTDRPTVVITVDTEPDCDTRWRRASPPSYRSITDGIPRVLEPIFDRYGARATYLLSPEVVQSRECVAVLRAVAGKHELGAHLHPEYIEPRRKYVEIGGTRASAFACNAYSDQIELAKIDALAGAMEQAFGKRPRSYRAGRFGADAATARALEALGFAVDSSVTPGLSWSDRGGPDFRFAPEQPYHPSPEDLAREGTLRLLEVPVTIGRTRLDSLRLPWFLRPWLRPSTISGLRMASIAQSIARRYPGAVLTVMFHSMEMIAGASPASRTPWLAQLVANNLDRFLRHCAEAGWRFATLSDVAARHATRAEVP